jgi:hypothetical protein
MVELKNISKFFLALTKAGGQLSRTDLAVKIFGRNWSAKKLDELVSSPLLALLVDSTKKPIRGKGRRSLRYFLMPLGWQIARSWKLPVKADRINPEEIQHQFQLLVRDGHPWAKPLDVDAGLWRQHDEAERRLRAEKAEKKAEKERTHPEVKRDPASKKPHRSRGAKSDADRADFFFRKLREKEGEPAVTPHPAPSVEQSRPKPVYSGDGGFRTQPTAPLPAAASVAQRPQPRPRMVADVDRESLDAEDLRILRVASEHMYQRNEESKILYDNRWVTPKEWWEKMKSNFE